MAPFTRYQSKKKSLKKEPYSRKKCVSEKRTVLLDVVKNNVSIFNIIYSKYIFLIIN